MGVDVGGQVLGNKPVEQHAEDIALEVPAIDRTTQVVGDAPDRLVELGALSVGGSAHGSFFDSWELIYLRSIHFK